jgi:hypothetical protein
VLTVDVMAVLSQQTGAAVTVESDGRKTKGVRVSDQAAEARQAAVKGILGGRSKGGDGRGDDGRKSRAARGDGGEDVIVW